ncbi:MAG: hypothetical protein WKF92_01500 [Pyrinomonadaceae bacterium]
MENDRRLKDNSPYSLTRFETEIDKACRHAVREALLMHKRAGNPVAVWRDGKVVLLQPDEIEVAEAE